MRAGAILLVVACTSLASNPVRAQTQLLRPVAVDAMRGYPVARVGTADFDGDGLVDLAGISFVASPDTHTQEKLLVQHQVAGSPLRFRDAGAYPVVAPQDLLVQDLDGDGDPDLAVVQDSGDDALAIWINQGGAQGGPRGQLNRLPLTLAYDLAMRVVAVDTDANPATPPALLLVRGTGRDPLLFDNRLHQTPPVLALQQTLAHPGAVGASVSDVDANGYPDLLVYGEGCRLWRHLGAIPGAPYVLAPTEPCGIGLVHAALLQPGSGSASYQVALATASGDTWVSATPSGFFRLPLASSTIGITRDFALIDADGDGDQDLVAARPNENAPAPAQRGSPVYRRIGDGFEGALQTLESAWSADRLSLGATPTLALAHPLQTTTLWQAQPAGSVVPVVQFVSHYGLYPAPNVVGQLAFQPFSTVQTSVHLVASTISGSPVAWSEDLGVGLRTLAADAPVNAAPGTLWTLDLTEVAPAGAGSIGSNSRMTVTVVGIKPPPEFCFLESLFQMMAILLGEANGSASPEGSTELDRLRRVRDERLAGSAAGQYYASLYTRLGPDLYAASIADPQFVPQLWALKDAWMPAIDNWLDGDGQALVSGAMQESLSEALGRLQAHASGDLHEALARERRALGLDHLAGRPIGEIQSRWEQSPLFGDGFD